MSAGDVVFSGWLIKSPPEKKLKRYTWRKRWFVLRGGRMSGNPDVLEYYQTKSSKKPIRIIDLKECEVQTQTGQLVLKRQFHEKHPFVVKTSTRIFYLIAKTEEEMKSWIQSISKICQFGPLDHSESAGEGLSHTLASPEASPVTPSFASLDREAVFSQHESYPTMDYLFLSECETGDRVSISRWDSFSTSESSLDQRSSDEGVENIFPSSFCGNVSVVSFPNLGHSSSTLEPGCVTDPPLSAPSTFVNYDRPCNFPSLLPRPSASSIFRFDRVSHPHPPLLPKPNNFPELLSEERTNLQQQIGSMDFSGHYIIPRRISFSGLDHLQQDIPSSSERNRRLSLNLQTRLNTPHMQPYQEDSYVPMNTPTPTPTPTSIEAQTPTPPVDVTDGYIPMSPGTRISIKSNCTIEYPVLLSPDMCQPSDLVPPPVNRHLKPRRKARPPPLDLSSLSTIRECPHLPLDRTMTEARNSVNCLLERRLENAEANGDNDTSCNISDSRLLFFFNPDGPIQPLPRKSNLDYLSLDFNSASPSPVQKKPFLSDEHRVDYVKVDEKKTQALQNTRMEWTDVRQSNNKQS